MQTYRVFNQIYLKNGKYFYKKYNTMLPIEQGTLYLLDDNQLKDYIKNGYKLLDLKGASLILVKNY